MRRSIIVAAAVAVGLGAAGTAIAQVAGTTPLGVAVAELREVTLGWSAKRQIIGHAVFNDKDEKIGSVDDIIVAPDKAISYAIIGAGGFLGVGKHDVAIPVNQFRIDGKKLVLAGASKDALRALPTFEYAH